MIRLAWFLVFAATLSAQTPEWIWGPAATDDETRHFRKTFPVPPNVTRLIVTLAADNQAELRVKEAVVNNSLWDRPTRTRITPTPESGPCTVEVTARNAGGPAGLLVRLELIKNDGTREFVVTDSTWETSTDGQTGWVAATSLGPVGVEPWGDVLVSPVATPAESLTTLPGFKVELLRSAEPGEGSWVAMTTDSKGRLIISPQGGEPMRRLTLDDAGKIAQMETIDLPVRGAMGLLHAFDALYVNGQGPDGYHLYRLTDSDGDDQYDRVELLRRWKSFGKDGATGEHGAHAIVKGPDDHLYIVNGNFVDVPEDLVPASPVRNYADDVVLPRLEDGNGFGSGRQPPGGYVLRVTPDGQNAELFAAGQRNTYDITFNRDGELFGYDSDMEWDWGMPWYRPTRIYHIVSGGDQGFREGSAKWPEYYADSLPEVVNIGIGSPTGLLAGTGARFPGKYQRALYALDWSYGRILAVHLEPNGASYTATLETLVKGKPLNVTDAVVGPDGALYFTTGGRGTQSGLYRVSYDGPEDTSRQEVEIALFTPEMAARAERRKLEEFHHPTAPGRLDEIWPALGNPDRAIRYAARIALEALPVAQWKARAVAETNATAGLTSLLALSRYGAKEDQLPLLQALARWPLGSLDDNDYLTKLRVIEVSFARHGIPAEVRARARERLDAQFPAPSLPKNRELVQLLVALDSPDVVAQALDLRDAAPTQEEQVIYQVALRRAREGWTPEWRERYFRWFNRPPQEDGGPTYPAGGNYFISRSVRHPEQFDQWFADVGLRPGNGSSFDNFLKNIRQEAFLAVPDADKAPIAALIAPQPEQPVRSNRQRNLVREWKITDLEPVLSQAAQGRNFRRGEQVYRDAQCAVCHRFHGEGGSGGPDLTGLGTRYTAGMVLQSLLQPNEVISEQYQAISLTLKNDDTVWGQQVGETAEAFELLVDPLAGKTSRILKVDVKDRSASPISPMPEGLLNTFTQDEILDLLAYLQSDADPQAAAFSK